MNILVAGSTGQLGYTITRMLAETDHMVTALHRKSSDITPLEELIGTGSSKKGNVVNLANEGKQEKTGIILLEGNVLDKNSVEKAVRGMDVVISTVNTNTPVRKDDRFKTTDLQGNLNLIEASKKAGVSQFIFTSASGFDQRDNKIPVMKYKRIVEQALMNSGVPYTIFRPPAFMDIVFAFLGTDLVLEGERVHTLRRPFRFSNRFFDGIRYDIEKKNRFNYIGKGTTRNSFIAVHDVARFHVNAAGRKEALNRIIPIGGPEPLTVLEVKKIFEEVYDKKLTGKSTPAFVMKVLSNLLKPFNPQGANIMALNYAGAIKDNVISNANEVAEEFGVELTTARSFIETKMIIRKSLSGN